MSSDEVERVRLSTDEERLRELQEEEHRLIGLNISKNAEIALLEETNYKMQVIQLHLHYSLAAAVRRKKHLKMQVCLWKGILAVRRRSLTTALKKHRSLKIDNAWRSSLSRRISRELFSLQRRCDACWKQTQQQNDDTRQWFRDNQRDIICYLGWCKQEMREGRAVISHFNPGLQQLAGPLFSRADCIMRR